MSLLFNGTNAANGFDSLGHYVRDEPLVGDCTGYATTPGPWMLGELHREPRGRRGERRRHRAPRQVAAAPPRRPSGGERVDVGARCKGCCDYLIGAGG